MYQEGMFREQMKSKPSYSEIAEKLLTNEMLDNMNDLIKYMKGFKLKPMWYATNSFNFKYKGKIVFRFSIGKGAQNAMNQVNLFQTVVDRNDLDNTLFAMPDDLRNLYFENLRYCSHCNPKHGNGKAYQILGNQYFICAEPEVNLKNPNKNQIEMIKRFVEIRIDNIKANQR